MVKNSDYKSVADSKKEMVQGFLNRNPERTVRVRLIDGQGILTIKGMSSEDGLIRNEWEWHISEQEARELLNICEPGVIEKTRYFVPNGALTFEIDEFYGDNHGLVIAEIELPSPETEFERPSWLGEEVTGLPEYYNSQLSKKPFSRWKP